MAPFILLDAQPLYILLPPRGSPAFAKVGQLYAGVQYKARAIVCLGGKRAYQGYLVNKLVLKVREKGLYGSLRLDSYSSVHASILHLLQNLCHLLVWVLCIGCILYNSFQVECIHVSTS